MPFLRDVAQVRLCCLRPPEIINSQPVPKIPGQQPTSFISMITLAMENATLTGLVSTQPGSFLRNICTNREATPRRPFVVPSETCV